MKEKVGTITKTVNTLSEDVPRMLTLISEKLNTLSNTVRTGTPTPNTGGGGGVSNTSPRKLPLPRGSAGNVRPRSNHM